MLLLWSPLNVGTNRFALLKHELGICGRNVALLASGRLRLIKNGVLLLDVVLFSLQSYCSLVIRLWLLSRNFAPLLLSGDTLGLVR